MHRDNWYDKIKPLIGMKIKKPMRLTISCCCVEVVTSKTIATIRNVRMIWKIGKLWYLEKEYFLSFSDVDLTHYKCKQDNKKSNFVIGESKQEHSWHWYCYLFLSKCYPFTMILPVVGFTSPSFLSVMYKTQVI